MTHADYLSELFIRVFGKGSSQMAHCSECGVVLSEWFVMHSPKANRMVMYHCGELSDWASHEEFRESLAQVIS